jgi:hypothetical protein
MNPIDYLRLGVEQYLRELPDDEFDGLVELVRPSEDGRQPGGSDRANFANALFSGSGD